MNFVILSALLFVSISVCGQQPASDVKQSQTITRSTYSIAYPASWSVDTSKAFGMDLLIRSPRTDSLDDFVENVNVFVQDLKGQVYTLSKMGTESETQIKNFVTDVVITESKMDTLGPDPIYRLSYRGRQGKYELTTIQRYYLKNEIGYAITLTLKSSTAGQYLEIGETIFSAFKFR